MSTTHEEVFTKLGNVQGRYTDIDGRVKDVLYSLMASRLSLIALVALAACSPLNRGENSAICGITMLASATRIVDQINLPHMALSETPRALTEGIVPARVVGYGTTAAVAGMAEDGSAVVGYQGEGFPTRPGFGAALVDDSSEVFRGILIWDKEPPPDTYPLIGTIASANSVLPLIGIRVSWASVNSERCPLFANLDSLTR
jgi:hypothetical protein